MSPIHHPEHHRWIVPIDGAEEAVLTYEEVGGGVLDLQHTVVPPAARGRGVADALVRAAVAHARDTGGRLVPTCPYVAAWMRRHPDAHDVLADGVDVG